MGEASISIRNELPQSRRNPQRVAWGVLLICFAIFCLTCTATGVGIYYFLFLSETPLDVMVRVGRGSIGVNRQFEEVERALSSGSEVSIASPSQATIFVRDPQQGERLMAVMTVSGGSNLNLLNALRPRFDWSANLFQIEIGEFTGDLNIWIVHDLERELRLIIQTSQHNRIDLGESGQYMVSVREGQTRVVNQDGKAVLIPPDGNNGRDIPPGSQGVINEANPAEVVL
ncbi:MAG TPA: hypothetical protein VHO69_19725, partial [Phototrophicaceae bacterium]|nr:hypothetical protein [Phototrophicaceae bacterium]